MPTQLQSKQPKGYYDVRETSFKYSFEDYQIIEKLGITIGETPYGVQEAKGGRLILPQEEGQKHITNLHNLTHLGAKKLKDVIRSLDYYVIGLSDVANEVVNCKACAVINAGHSLYTPGKRLRGDRPGAYWEVDFMEFKPAKYGNKYLLVFVDTFSGWVEAFPPDEVYPKELRSL